MVILYQSQTLPINPPNSTPVLTLAQIWSVMDLKCRKPEIFVAPMSSSEVLSETPTFMKRSVVFKEGMGPPAGKVTEELQIRKPWKVRHACPFIVILGEGGMGDEYKWLIVWVQVDFYNTESGAFINNTISQGKDETDLYLTFYFEWPYPDLKEGSKEAEEMSERLWGMAKKTVQHTIDYARDMAREGKLEPQS